jgi:chromosome segregation ATPase
LPNSSYPQVCEEHKVRAPEGKVRKPLRPISAAVNSPARRAESKKTAWQKHVKRLRPVTALKKFDHLQEYRDRMPTKVASLKTDPESLAELRDSVTNFQAKFRQSILSGLIAQYKKKKEQEVMKVDAQELEKKAAAFAIRLEEFDSEIEGLQEQARPLEDKVDAVQKMIQVSRISLSFRGADRNMPCGKLF